MDKKNDNLFLISITYDNGMNWKDSFEDLILISVYCLLWANDEKQKFAKMGEI